MNRSREDRTGREAWQGAVWQHEGSGGMRKRRIKSRKARGRRGRTAAELDSRRADLEEGGRKEESSQTERVAERLRRERRARLGSEGGARLEPVAGGGGDDGVEVLGGGPDGLESLGDLAVVAREGVLGEEGLDLVGLGVGAEGGAGAGEAGVHDGGVGVADLGAILVEVGLEVGPGEVAAVGGGAVHGEGDVEEVLHLDGVEGEVEGAAA
mmetsp:Transcript_10619/g.33971  ORF Transcript_10619/g.33971 Transcript_10619/m.33971 type:complete len:211 (+) Transcript_10619:202-834(+)